MGVLHVDVTCSAYLGGGNTKGGETTLLIDFYQRERLHPKYNH